MMRNRRTRAIASCVAVLISLAVASSVVEAEQTQDRTGLDIICPTMGGTYNKIGNTVLCCFSDGHCISCDNTTDKCTTLGSGNPNSHSVENLITLQAAAITLGKLNDLASQVSSLATQVSDLGSACGLK